jgi:hypothetical protein
MSLFHGGDLGRTRLLAADALEGEERSRAEKHVSGCAECRAELEGVWHLLALLERDPVHHAEPRIQYSALKARVDARLREPGRASGFRPALAAAAAVALAFLTIPVLQEPRAAEAPLADRNEAMDRLERTLTREETARYLSAAQEVLVTVSSPSRCHLKAGHLDVGEESRRSRTLLERRVLLVGSETVPSAQPVLNDVEKVLREVASLDPCTSRSALEEIHREVSEKRLLLRIDLMTEELAG